MKKIIIYSLFITIITFSKLTATLDFANRNVSIALRENNSSLKITNLDGLKGWREMSIVRASGNNNSWASNLYTSAPDHLIYNNSNAIISGGFGIPASLTQAVINNSNSIVTLNGRVTMNESDIATNAGNISTNAGNISTNAGNVSTNAGNISTNATAISNNQIYIKGNSHYSNHLQEFIKNNSNAIIGGGFGIPASLTQAVINNSNAITHIADPANPDGISYLTQHFVSLNGGIWYTTGEITGETFLAGRGTLSSPINLQNKTLTLGGDLIMSSSTQILSSGFLNPRGYAFLLGGDLTIPAGITLTFSGDGIMDGQGNNLIFQGDGKIKLDPYVTVTFRNIALQEVKDFSPDKSSICMSAFRSKLVLQNAQINLDRNFTFSLGELYIHGDVAISGTNQFNYTSTNAALINRHSTLFFDMNTTLSYGPLSDNRNLIKMTDETSMLYLNGAALMSTTTGIQLTRGTLVLDHKNYLFNQDYSGKPATSISQAIIFGDGDSDNDLRIQVMPGGSLDMKSGILDYQNSN